VVSDVFLRKSVEPPGGDSFPDVRPQKVHHLRVESAGGTQSRPLLLVLINRQPPPPAQCKQPAHCSSDSNALLLRGDARDSTADVGWHDLREAMVVANLH
jgi:hypothetical protein